MIPQIIPIKIDATATLEDTLSQINPAINAAHGAAKSSLLCFKVIPTLRFPFLINAKGAINIYLFTTPLFMTSVTYKIFLLQDKSEKKVKNLMKKADEKHFQVLFSCI